MLHALANDKDGFKPKVVLSFRSLGTKQLTHHRRNTSQSTEYSETKLWTPRILLNSTKWKVGFEWLFVCAQTNATKGLIADYDLTLGNLIGVLR